MADTAPSLEDQQLAEFRQAKQTLADTYAAVSDPNLDRRSGADLMATAAVGAAPTPADELSTLRKYYPDAKPFGDGNYVFTHPDTKRPTLYKATSSDLHPLSWLARNAQEVPTLVGGGVGGVLGATVGGAAAGPPGAVAGAMMGAGGGANASLEAYRGFMKYLAGTDDTRTPMQHFTDAVTNTTINAAGEGAGRAFQGGVRAAMPIVGKADPLVTRAADNLGVDISGMPALATGSKALNASMEHFGAIPTATNTLEAGRQGVRNALTEAQQRIVSNLAGPGGTPTVDTGEAMGRLQTGLQGRINDYDTIRTGVQTRLGALGQDVSVVPYNLQNTVAALKQGARDAPGTRKEVQPAIDFAQDILDQSLHNAVTQGHPGVAFPGMLKERTTLGGKIDFPAEGERADATQKAYMAVRDAVKNDLYDAAQRVGNSNPQLAPLLQLHDQYVTGFRGGQTPFSSTVGPGQYLTIQDIGKLVEKDPAALFDAVNQNSFKAGLNGGDGTALMRVRNSVDDDTWRNTAAHYFERMFQPNPGVAQTPGQVAGTEPVSGLAQFATKWNAMSDGAKRALFDGYLPPGQRQQLDSLATLANQYVKAGYDVNRSGSGIMQVALKALTNPFTLPAIGMVTGHPIAGMVGGAASLAGLGGAPVVMRLMQSPTFTRWLASSAREVMASPNRLSTALGRLGAMQFEPAMKRAVDQYIGAVRSQAPQGQGATP